MSVVKCKWCKQTREVHSQWQGECNTIERGHYFDPEPLTEQDVRRIVLDVLERWLKAQDIDENNWMNRNQREFAAIAAVRKEMGL